MPLEASDEMSNHLGSCLQEEYRSPHLNADCRATEDTSDPITTHTLSTDHPRSPIGPFFTSLYCNPQHFHISPQYPAAVRAIHGLGTPGSSTPTGYGRTIGPVAAIATTRLVLKFPPAIPANFPR
ncbi:hypothetical protein N7448_004781 [Penicillium atrosanguineum]|uniref:Uncharacterized protein n=1 Tax=Penicillium atrosanguineum TaxID=1132637 RepID=A0A9W9PPQ5_9EURO|nr:uncharacterized protein N7443_008530 [Penicillium atrosanguineum]KAJ5136227.1 hypothetical protein N7448_004781 [Penicillium atrosanguineum]KAJ5292577.1 hypothetical protein N7443_008530 [Penicillium atrosanguineum]KAJ5303399.1 hypothetical protein N7476_010198 [Penicillium atrosanguineum]